MVMDLTAASLREHLAAIGGHRPDLCDAGRLAGFVQFYNDNHDESEFDGDVAAHGLYVMQEKACPDWIAPPCALAVFQWLGQVGPPAGLARAVAADYFGLFVRTAEYRGKVHRYDAPWLLDDAEANPGGFLAMVLAETTLSSMLCRAIGEPSFIANPVMPLLRAYLDWMMSRGAPD